MDFSSTKFKRRFAIATLSLAFVHFSLEMTYTVSLGQSFLGLLPDLLADALLIFGSYLLLKDDRLTGVICGAWGLHSVFIIALGPGATKHPPTVQSMKQSLVSCLS